MKDLILNCARSSKCPPCHLVLVHRFWQHTVLAQLSLRQVQNPREAFQYLNNLNAGCRFRTNLLPARLPPEKQSKCAITCDHMLNDVPSCRSALCQCLAKVAMPAPPVFCFGTQCWCLASCRIEQ